MKRKDFKRNKTFRNIGDTLVISEGVTYIECWGYKGRVGFTSVTIPSSVKRIGRSAFQGCSGLTSVTISEGVREIQSRAFDGCTGLTKIVLPSSGTMIGGYAFRGCSALESVTIPEGETAIGEHTFDGCRALTSVTIPSSVWWIGAHAFDGCRSLTSLTIPPSVTMIGERAFSGCVGLTIETLTIPREVEDMSFLQRAQIHRIRTLVLEKGRSKALRVGKARIYGVERVFAEDIETLPRMLRPAAVIAFAETGRATDDEYGKGYLRYIRTHVRKLLETAVRHPELLRLMCAQRLIDAEAYEPLLEAVSANGDTAMTAELLAYRSRVLTQSDMDRVAEEKQRRLDTVLRRTVERVGREGLDGLSVCVATKLKRFRSRDELKRMLEEKGAKLVDELTEEVDLLVTIDTGNGGRRAGQADTLGIEMIGEAEFIKRYGPFYVIEDGVLTRCIHARDVDELVLPASMKSVAWGALDGGCGRLVLGSGVTRIKKAAFRECKGLRSVMIPESVTEIGEEAFRGCKSLTSVTIPSGVEEIGMRAFYDCDGLTSVTIQPGVRTIGWYAFKGCRGLTSVTIPESVTKIGWYAFKECCGLKSVTIPESVTKIGTEAFYGCDGLTLIVRAGSFAEKYARKEKLRYRIE